MGAIEDCERSGGGSSYVSTKIESLAHTYGCTVHDLLRVGKTPIALAARSHLVKNLLSRGWPLDVIERKAGVPQELARAAAGLAPPAPMKKPSGEYARVRVPPPRLLNAERVEAPLRTEYLPKREAVLVPAPAAPKEHVRRLDVAVDDAPAPARREPLEPRRIGPPPPLPKPNPWGAAMRSVVEGYASGKAKLPEPPIDVRLSKDDPTRIEVSGPALALGPVVVTSEGVRPARPGEQPHGHMKLISGRAPMTVSVREPVVRSAPPPTSEFGAEFVEADDEPETPATSARVYAEEHLAQSPRGLKPVVRLIPDILAAVGGPLSSQDIQRKLDGRASLAVVMANMSTLVKRGIVVRDGPGLYRLVPGAAPVVPKAAPAVPELGPTIAHRIQEILDELGQPMAVADIVEVLDGVPFGSVASTLSKMDAKGIVRRVGTSRYALAAWREPSPTAPKTVAITDIAKEFRADIKAGAAPPAATKPPPRSPTNVAAIERRERLRRVAGNDLLIWARTYRDLQEDSRFMEVFDAIEAVTSTVPETQRANAGGA